MKKTHNVFFDTFAGEFVEIILDLEITNNINLTEDGHAHEMKMPLTVQGFVMDIDDTFIYLSPDGENVNQAFPITDLKHIAIVELKDQVDEILDEIEPPETDAGYN